MAFPNISSAEQLLEPNTANLLQEEVIRQYGDQFLDVELAPGDMMLRSMVSKVQVGDGMRVVSIGVNPVTNVGNQVRPGDRVDVVVSYMREGEGGAADQRAITEMLLQNVEVAGVASESWRRSDPIEVPRFSIEDETIDSTTVTLILAPEEAMELIYMDNFARGGAPRAAQRARQRRRGDAAGDARHLPGHAAGQPRGGGFDAARRADGALRVNDSGSGALSRSLPIFT